MSEWDRCTALLLREPSLYTIVCWLISLHYSFERSEASSSSFSYWELLDPLLFPAVKELSFSPFPLYLKAQTQRNSIFHHHCPKCVSQSEVIYIFLLCKRYRWLSHWHKVCTRAYDFREFGKLVRSKQYCCGLESIMGLSSICAVHWDTSNHMW